MPCTGSIYHTVKYSNLISYLCKITTYILVLYLYRLWHIRSEHCVHSSQHYILSNEGWYQIIYRELPSFTHMHVKPTPCCGLHHQGSILFLGQWRNQRIGDCNSDHMAQSTYTGTEVSCSQSRCVHVWPWSMTFIIRVCGLRSFQIQYYPCHLTI